MLLVLLRVLNFFEMFSMLRLDEMYLGFGFLEMPLLLETESCLQVFYVCLGCMFALPY